MRAFAVIGWVVGWFVLVAIAAGVCYFADAATPSSPVVRLSEMAGAALVRVVPTSASALDWYESLRPNRQWVLQNNSYSPPAPLTMSDAIRAAAAGAPASGPYLGSIHQETHVFGVDFAAVHLAWCWTLAGWGCRRAAFREHWPATWRAERARFAAVLFILTLPVLAIAAACVRPLAWIWLFTIIHSGWKACVVDTLSFPSALATVLMGYAVPVVWAARELAVRMQSRPESGTGVPTRRRCCWKCGYPVDSLALCPECGQHAPALDGRFYMTRWGASIAQSPAKWVVRGVLASVFSLLLTLPAGAGIAQLLWYSITSGLAHGF